MNLIEKWAKAIEKHEGRIAPNKNYPNGSRSYRNNNSGNLRFTSYTSSLGANRGKDDKNFIIYTTYQVGFNALVQFLIDAATDKLRAYRSTMTLYDFYAAYAPTADGNYPRGYAEAVAKDMGVSPSTVIKTFVEVSAPEPTQSPAPQPVPENVKIVLPIDLVYVTQEFGARPDVYAQFGLKGHNGIDFRTKFLTSPLGGREIVSVMKGIVTEVVNQGSGGYGLYVRIQHRGNEETIYGHLKKVYVKKGDKVEPGSLIAISDNSGFSSGAHLHFGWRPQNFAYSNGFKGYEDPRKLFGNLLKK